jgi:hypothetical protein
MHNRVLIMLRRVLLRARQSSEGGLPAATEAHGYEAL